MRANSGPVWGATRRTGAATTTAYLETFLLGQRPLIVSVRHKSDLAWLGLAPRPVTGAYLIEPDGVRPRLQQQRLQQRRQRLLRPDDRVQTN